MICVIIKQPYGKPELHIRAAPSAEELVTVCGWTYMNEYEEVEGEPTCEDCKKAVWHYKCLEVKP